MSPAPTWRPRAFARLANWSRERFSAPAKRITRAQAEGLAAALAAAAPGVGPSEPRRPERSRLDQLEPGEAGIILRLEGNSGLERRLMELGLVPGTAVEVVRRAPFGDPVEIRVRDVSLSLRRSETSRIHVAPR